MCQINGRFNLMYIKKLQVTFTYIGKEKWKKGDDM